MNEPIQVIWKFTLNTNRIQRVSAPFIKEFLSVQIQEGDPVFWAKVYRDSARREYVILCFPTHFAEVKDDTKYLGTVQLDNGEVYHYFLGGPQ